NLQKLESINVQHNNLKEIPASIWQCGCLVSLNATSNLLSTWLDAPDIAPAQDENSSSALRSGNDRKPSSAGQVDLPPSPLSQSLQKLYLGDNQLVEDV